MLHDTDGRRDSHDASKEEHDKFMKSHGLNNTASSRRAFETVSAQIRTRGKINMRKLKYPTLMSALQAMFEEFDVDGNGKVDEEELYTGLTEIAGVAMSRYEVSLLFPLFDLDDNKSIELPEFFAAILADHHSTSSGAGERSQSFGSSHKIRKHTSHHHTNPRTIPAVHITHHPHTDGVSTNQDPH
jgi:Ca2+-binding EF-hand superfamily protein